MSTLITAKSPAAFAEEYILNSIWNGKFAAGTILPAERELSEQIGVTRTTLREVLQRLARDGWLDIQHGKPTRVNDIWDKAGLHCLETILRLDEEGSHHLAEKVLSTRILFGQQCFFDVIPVNSSKLVGLLDFGQNLKEDSPSYIEFDELLYREVAKLSENPVYRLILNGFEMAYRRIASNFYSHEQSRNLTQRFYLDLKALVEQKNIQGLSRLFQGYTTDTIELWEQHSKNCNFSGQPTSNDSE
jgi:GntR family negative regulator for fad regulon and positive regulator of fabA